MIYDASVDAIGFIHEVKNDMVIRLELVSKIRPDWKDKWIEQPIYLHHSGSLHVANLDKHDQMGGEVAQAERHTHCCLR